MWRCGTTTRRSLTTSTLVRLASHDLWLFAERIPHVVLDWFPHHLDEAARLVVQLREAATVLNAAGVVHFDAHFGNALADGAVFYLSDFGLAMSDQFDLTADERAFLDAHRDYDHAEIIWSLSQPLRTVYGSLPPEARTSVDRVLGGPMHPPSPEFLSAALDHLEAIAEPMALPAAYVEFVRRYAQVALVMDSVLHRDSRPAQAGPVRSTTTSPSSSPSPTPTTIGSHNGRPLDELQVPALLQQQGSSADSTPARRHTTSTVLPIVSRDSRARWAAAASASGNRVDERAPATGGGLGERQALERLEAAEALHHRRADRPRRARGHGPPGRRT